MRSTLGISQKKKEGKAIGRMCVNSIPQNWHPFSHVTFTICTPSQKQYIHPQKKQYDDRWKIYHEWVKMFVFPYWKWLVFKEGKTSNCFQPSWLIPPSLLRFTYRCDPFSPDRFANVLSEFHSDWVHGQCIVAMDLNKLFIGHGYRVRLSHAPSSKSKKHLEKKWIYIYI